MAITFVNSTETEQDTTGGNLTIAVPGSVVDDDVLIAIVVHSDDAPATTITPPSGWTEELGKTGMGTAAVSPPVIYVYSRVASSEPANYTWSWDTNGGKVGSILAYRGVDTLDPVPAAPSVNAQTGTGTNPIAPSVTTSEDGEFIICAGWCDDDDLALNGSSYPGGMNGRHEAETTTGGNGCGLSVADEEIVTAGSTGTRTFSLAASEERSGITIRLNVGPVGGNYDQDSFRARNDDGSESAATWKAAVNTDWEQPADENFRIRFLVEELDDVAEDDVQFQLQYNKNSGGWNDVNGGSLNVRSSASSNVVDGADTTEQLSGPGTFITNNDGFDEANGLAGGTVLDFTTTVNQEVELEYCCQVRGVDVSNGDSIQLRLVKEADVLLDTYTNTPTLTVPAARYTQTSYRGRNDDGSESTATWKGLVNTDWDQAPDENFRIRFLIEETTDLIDSNVEFQLQYNKNTEGWNNVTGASSVAQASASTNLTDAGNTTEQLSGPGTFITPNDGIDEANGIAGGADLDFSSTINQEVELEYCLQLVGADLVDFDTVQFRLVVATGTGTVDTYTNIPSVTTLFPPAWEMNLTSNFADGDSTTRQLSDSVSQTFIAGKTLEDDPIADQVDVDEGNFTEYEWCIQATTSAVASTQYEFRVKDDEGRGEVIDTYNVTPRITTAP